VTEVKDTSLNPDSKFDLENIENRQIIEEDPTTTVVNTTIQLEEPVDIEEGEFQFHSHMWVKVTHRISLLIKATRRNLSQLKSSNIWGC
jgi:hypothetical protein